jgi:hypothetical protein
MSAVRGTGDQADTLRQMARAAKQPGRAEGPGGAVVDQQ